MEPRQKISPHLGLYAHIPKEQKMTTDAERFPEDEGPDGKWTNPDGRKQVVRYADEAMYPAETLAEDGEVRPRVEVISLTSDPLRVMASVHATYSGRRLAPEDVTQEMAIAFAKDCLLSKIKAPLEWVQLALRIDGVSRDFTHQMVRQRTATYAQESMRFAVKDNAANEVPEPPSIAALDEEDELYHIWKSHVAHTGWVYNKLIAGNIPAEDARKALLIGTATWLHYRTNLRDLVEHSGLRLCSQAQSEWKIVWREIIQAIMDSASPADRWQWREIIKLFRPVCYATGKCEFMGAADRYCVIRDRVEAHHAKGERPEVWLDINPLEPLHHEAARR